MSMCRGLGLFAFAMAACRTASPSADVATAGQCLVVDTSVPGADTVYVIGAVATRASRDCAQQPAGEGEAPVVIAMVPPAGADLRDVLEGRAGMARRPDVMTTSDPQVIDLARRSAGFLVEPLPWSTTYVLTIPARDSLLPPGMPDRDALARDAVVAEARGAVGPFSWQGTAGCQVPLTPPRSATPVVAFPADDPIARALAARLVSLVGASPRPAWLSAMAARGGAAWRVLPVRQDSLIALLIAGRAGAAVLPVMRDPTTPCGTRDGAPVPQGSMPLVDSRTHVLVRRGSGATFIIGADGGLRFVKRGAR